MARTRTERVPKGGLYDTIDQVVTDGIHRGLGHLSTEDDVLDGRVVHVGGKEYLNFGTASYMALEKHPALVAGARDALERYGTQFASSRTYLQLGLYDELEANLETIFGRPALAAGSTTLGHLSALPVLVHDDDAVILDQQVHSSIQVVAQVLKARGVPLILIRHNRMDQLEDRIRKLRNKHRRIWYMADGVYSMFGNGAPVEELHALMDAYPQLRVYIDDAHGFGWDGEHGSGYVRARVPHHPQLTLAVSLNKSYASAGGALIFGDDRHKQRLRNCGPTFIFCGPIQPPMLGSAVAATRLHLSDALPAMQADIKERIAYCTAGLAARGLPEVLSSETPLYFVPTGLPRVVYDVAQRLFDDGICVNIGLFPAVPMSQGGIRFHMHRGLAFADIDRLLDRLALHWKTVLTEHGVTAEHLARAFRQREFAALDLTPPSPVRRTDDAPALSVFHSDDIATVDPTAWDACFGGRGPFSHAALSALAPGFAATTAAGGATPHYVRVADDTGHTLLAAVCCVTRIKEDMFAPADVSAKVEARRAAEDPDFLVTTAVSLGLPVTLGEHLWVDHEHPRADDALQAFVDHLLELKEQVGATQILLRDFPSGDDAQKDRFLELGFVEVAMPDMMTLEDITGWDDRDGLLAALGGRYRRDVRKEILPHLDAVRIDAGHLDDAATRDAAYALYRQVHARALALNVFPLPRVVFDAMCTAPEFDVLRFTVTEDGVERLGCVMLSHLRDGRYSALLVGFDEALIRSHAIYKVSLFATVERAKALGATSVNLAFTADLVKKKVGARPVPTCAYALVDDTYGANVLMNL